MSTQGNDINEGVVASTLLLQDKERFLKAMIGKSSADTTKQLYKTVSDAVETRFVSWDDVIPRISNFKKSFDKKQVKSQI